MLLRTGRLPVGPGWRYEVKWDGFRALVSTEGRLRVRSRRGWDMTHAVPELADLPGGLVLDGELVAFNDNGDPHFPLLTRRVLNGDRDVPVHLMIFDVISIYGEELLSAPWGERRQQLEQLGLEGPAWSTPNVFEDGAALYEAVCERGLEGVVAKATRGRYRPGERVWIKAKNPSYWRRDPEREAVAGRHANSQRSTVRWPLNSRLPEGVASPRTAPGG
jgi:bifunctional non-homologous end joining protein LigD